MSSDLHQHPAARGEHPVEPDHQPPAPDHRLDGGEQLPVSIHPAGAASSENSSMGCGGDNPTITTRAAAAAADQITRLQHVLQWMRAAGIRPASIEVLLAIACGHHTPAEIRERTGLSANGCHVALAVLLGQGQGLRNGRVAGPRCQPLIGRNPDPHGARPGTWRYGLTADGENLLEILLGQPLANAERIPARG